jgi:hypothetical protein
MSVCDKAFSKNDLLAHVPAREKRGLHIARKIRSTKMGCVAPASYTHAFTPPKGLEGVKMDCIVLASYAHTDTLTACLPIVRLQNRDC